MRKLLRGLLLALLLSGPLISPAAAALSAAEKAEIQKLTETIRHLTLAWAYLGQAGAFTTTALQPAINNLWAGMLTPTTNLTDAYAMILHVNTAPPGDTAAYNAYETLPRPTLVANTMTTLSTVASGLSAAWTLADTAYNVAGQDGSYYPLMATVKNELTLASNSLAGFATGLAYATPRGTPWFPRLVTPHGNFIAATRFLHAATVKMIASMGFLRQVYNAPEQGEAPLPTTLAVNTAFNRYLQASSELILKFTFVLHTWVDIPISGHCQFSPHHGMARIMEKLTQVGSESASFTTPYRGGEHAGAPYRFHMAATFGTDFLEPLRLLLETRPLTWIQFNLGLARYFEAWQSQDGAMWEAMNFPAGVTLQQLRVQAGRTNVSNAPPLCPDATAPIATMIYPATGQTVRGRLTVIGECTDTIDDAVWGNGEKSTLCAKMELKVDGATVVTISTPPYEYPWDTTLMSNANHTLQWIGWDAANNQGPTATLTVTVGN